MNSFEYPSIDDVIQAHDQAINKSGGLPGVKDTGLIESTLDHIRNDDYYPEFIDKLTHLTFSIIKNHCFNDGNKRTSITSSHLFIHKNFEKIPNVNNDFCSDRYINAMENIVVFVADNLIDKDTLSKIMNFMLIKQTNYLHSFKIITVVLDEARNKKKLSDEMIILFLNSYLKHRWLQKIFLWLYKGLQND